MKKWMMGVLLASAVTIVGCKSTPVEVAQEPPAVPPSATPQPVSQPAQNSKEPAAKEKTSSDTKIEEQANPTPSPAPAKVEDDPKPVVTDKDKGKETPVSPADPAETGKDQPEPRTDQPNRPNQPEPSGEGTPSNNGISDEKLQEVVKKYEDQLTQLRAANLQKLNGLYDQVLAASQNGGSTTEVYNKFAQQAASMEEESQAQVNQVLLQLKNELAALQLATDSVNQLRSAYYAEVSKAEQQFADKLKSSLGKGK